MKANPEQRLMAAVLHDAIDVYRHPRLHARFDRGLLRDTEEWFRSDDRLWPFSFQHVCDALDLDPDAIRSALRQERLGQRLAA